ncbi:MAG: RluA family pseudouridine synthase [Bacteroidales bacterium]
MMKKTNKSNKKSVGKELCYQVKEASELMPFLMAIYPGKSRNSIKSLLSHKQVRVNKETITQYNHKLNPSDWVFIGEPSNRRPVIKGLQIVYEDQAIIVIDKEEGVLSVATDTEKRDTAYSTLSNYVKAQDPRNRIFVLHRLDRDTSGLMMFAKNQEVQEKMQRNWEQMVTERTYLAVVEGKIEQREGNVESYLWENKKSMKMHSSKDPNEGEYAQTHYRCLRWSESFSLLQCKLDTGKKNQIRVHLSDIGHPIIGDKKYGSKTNPIRRMALHACELAFVHPVTGKELYFSTPIPKKFTRILGAK